MHAEWRLEMASATDRGRVRQQNEDSLALDPDTGYAVLADGMGGYRAGEVASRIAVATVEAGVRKLVRQDGYAHLAGPAIERLLSDQAAHANAAVYRSAQDDEACAGMGTTLVAALWHATGMAVAHVGDSRLYRLRANRLAQLTRDHSLMQDQIDSGVISRDQARRAPNRNLVTRALGIAPEVEVEVHTYGVSPADVYLLCSDGLTEMLDDMDIERTLVRGAGDLACAAASLVQQANERGGRDNVSVILAQLVNRNAGAGSGTPAAASR